MADDLMYAHCAIKTSFSQHIYTKDRYMKMIHGCSNHWDATPKLGTHHLKTPMEDAKTMQGRQERKPVSIVCTKELPCVICQT